MKHATVVKASLILSLAGIFLLFAILLFSDPEEIKISEAELSKFEDVRMEGYVHGIKKFGSVTIIELAEIKKIEVVVFDNRTLPEPNSTVIVSGEIREYKGRKQVIADSIRKI